MLQNKLIQSQLEELECLKNCDQEANERELMENQSKIQASKELYYDRNEDERWMAHYYRNIKIDDSTPEQLFHQLHQLILNTHKHHLPYYVSKDQFLYTWVDLHSNGRLKGLYSQKDQEPLKVMKEDYETVQRRFRRYQELMADQRFPVEHVEKRVIHISRQHRYNTEHIVPQSWFEGKEPMKGDLHHLFVCEPECNQARANYPFFDYQFYKNKKSESISSDCGTYEIGRFEPLYGKGAAARATFYFLLRYPDKISQHYRKNIDRSVLQYWNEKFSVNDYEKHRNKAIFEIQGNRNPFIDFPHLVNKMISLF